MAMLGVGLWRQPWTYWGTKRLSLWEITVYRVLRSKVKRRREGWEGRRNNLKGEGPD